jgi:hypothetical protein
VKPRVLAASAVLAVAAGSVGAAAGPVPPVPATGATPTRVDVPVRTASFPVYDGHGRRAGSAAWRMSPAGGNCCETYVSATPTGRIVESGGTYPWYSDDLGRTWYQVRFDVPDQNDNGTVIAGGEGAVVVGSGGDVYGVTWDAYSGDHLQAYRYRAQTDTWQVAEVLLKSPFYDRPWLTYAAGPFTLDGTRTRQLLDVTGGTVTKNLETLSPDGLDYGNPSYPANDEAQAPTAKMRIKVVPNRDADWWQPYPWAHTVPLTAGGVLHLDNTDDITGDSACDVARLNQKTATWQCVKIGAKLMGVVRQDSRGFLTEVYPEAGNTGLVLATSRDGGRHWKHTTLRPPAGAGKALETPDMFDVVANGRLGQAVVSARFDEVGGQGHDMVFRVDTRHAKPRLLETYLVGRGDLDTTNNVTGSLGSRFDYESVALLPDGRIVVSFDDSTCKAPTARDPEHRAPQVAVLA